MAFLRFSRDKRGVESFTLVHTTTNRRGKVRPRVLYWFRTPPDIKVGREPFDPELRRALEKQNPDITFDWRAIVETPIPSADADKWRERRRAERAAKHAAAAEASAESADGEDAAEDTAAAPAEEVVAASDAGEASAAPSGATLPSGATPSSAAPAPAAPRSGGDLNRKRRRRRRSGGRGGHASPPPSGGAPSGD